MMMATFCLRRSIDLGVLALALLFLSSTAQAQMQAPEPSRGGCGAPFAASRLVPAARVTLPGTNVSLGMPSVWSARPTTTADGTTAFLVNAPLAGPNGLVALGASNGEREKSLDQVAMNAANQLAGADTGRVTDSRKFALGRDCGVQLILRTKRVDGYVTVVRSGEWTYALVAKYPPATSAAMRAGLDTMVATVRLAPPSAPSAAANGTAPAQSYVGCWEATPDAHTLRNLTLGANGTYTWTRATTGLPYAVSPSEENGRYQVNGDSLTTLSEGETSTYAVSLSHGTLMIGDTRYFPCN